MKLSLINNRVCPPEPYFRYVFPEDGYAAVATTYDAWLAEAGKHAQANGLEGPTSEAMEEQLCHTLPPGWCNSDDPRMVRPATNLSWDDVSGALKTFGAWLMGGAKTVEQSEADRRALICTRCYLNVQVGGCSGCQQLIAEVLGKKQTKYDFALRACGVCKCVLRAKVHFPIDILSKENQELQDLYPEFCWLQKNGPNYRP